MCGEDGCANCSKFYLCSTNVFVVIIGIVLVILCVWVKGNDTVGPIIAAVPAIGSLLGYVIALGVMVVIVAAVGCVGSMTKQKYILMAYAGLLGVLIITKFVIAIVLFVKASKEKSEDVIEMLQKQFDDNPTYYMGLEGMLKCCGVTGTDTYTSKGMNPSPTCCKIGMESLPGMCAAEKAYPGCESKIWPILQPVYQYLAGFLLLLVFLELIMLLLTIPLLRSAMKE